MLDYCYRIGLWNRGTNATFKETLVKIFYSIYFMLFPLSLFGGAIQSDKTDETIFLTESATVVMVTLTNFLYVVWKKDEIIDTLQHMCVHRVKNQADFVKCNNKLNVIMNVLTTFWVITAVMATFTGLIAPFFGNERKLFFSIAFPLDWRNSEIAYWMAFSFLFTTVTLCTISVLFAILKWYFLSNCTMKYELLGNQLRNIGAIEVGAVADQRKILQMKKKNLFLRDLIAAIHSFEELKKYYL